MINWGRLVVIVPCLAFALCFMTMVWAFIDHDPGQGAMLATAGGVNLAMVLVILYYTRRK